MADSNIVVSGLTVAPGIGQLVLDWAAVDTSEFRSLPYMQLDKFEIWQSSTNNRANATKVGETPANQYVAKNLGASVTRYFWVRARDRALPTGNLGDFYPLSATAGISGTTSSVIPPPNSIDEDMLQDGAVTEDKIANAAITSAKIDTAAITEAKIANAAITNAKIGNLEITNAKIENLTIGTQKIGTLAVSRLSVFVNNGETSSLSVSPLTGTEPNRIGPLNEVASVDAVSEGGRVVVIASGSLFADGNGASNWGSFKAILYRAGTAVADCICRPDDENQDGFFFIPYIDTNPGASLTTRTYKVQIRYIESPGPGSNIKCRNRFLQCLNDMR